MKCNINESLITFFQMSFNCFCDNINDCLKYRVIKLMTVFYPPDIRGGNTFERKNCLSEKMRFYQNRLKSFKNCFDLSSKSVFLAENGFYYSDHEKSVTCNFCGASVSELDILNKSTLMNDGHYEICPLILNTPHDNIDDEMSVEQINFSRINKFSFKDISENISQCTCCQLLFDKQNITYEQLQSTHDYYSPYCLFSVNEATESTIDINADIKELKNIIKDDPIIRNETLKNEILNARHSYNYLISYNKLKKEIEVIKNKLMQININEDFILDDVFFNDETTNELELEKKAFESIDKFIKIFEMKIN